MSRRSLVLHKRLKCFNTTKIKRYFFCLKKKKTEKIKLQILPESFLNGFLWKKIYHLISGHLQVWTQITVYGTEIISRKQKESQVEGLPAGVRETGPSSVTARTKLRSEHWSTSTWLLWSAIHFINNTILLIFAFSIFWKGTHWQCLGVTLGLVLRRPCGSGNQTQACCSLQSYLSNPELSLGAISMV